MATQLTKFLPLYFYNNITPEDGSNSDRNMLLRIQRMKYITKIEVHRVGS